MHKRLLLPLATVAALLALAAASIVWSQPKPVPQAPPPAAFATAEPALVERGRYLAAVGDCVACHTDKGGERFAGGRPLQTPFGVVLSANLTPDQATGIGRYNADTFYRALHEGVDHDGHRLYPAFPYNYYTNVTREDSDAILAYLQSLPPVAHDMQRNQLPFPFNIRPLMVVWNWLFLDKGPYRADPSRSAEWNRGAYLVQGLGHCGACHTPKNLLGGPKRELDLHGGRFATWFAPDITPNRHTGLGGWSREALLEFLREGRNVHSAASGEMGEVVAFSTSQMSDADLSAVIAYLEDRPASPRITVAVPDAALMNQGEAIWQDACSACHGIDAQGVPRYFPTLKGNPNLQQSDPTTVLHFILAGTRRTPTDAAPTPLSMPAFGWKLSDAQVAAVATYARNSWGNAAPAVSASAVADLRKELAKDARAPGPTARAPSEALRHPGPRTWAPAGTDSRDNGTPRAGQPAAPAAPAAAAASAAPQSS